MSLDLVMEQLSKEAEQQKGILKVVWGEIVNGPEMSKALTDSIGLVGRYNLLWSHDAGRDIGTPATVEKMLRGGIGDACWLMLPEYAHRADNKPFRDFLIVCHLTNFYANRSPWHPDGRDPVFADTRFNCPFSGELKRWMAMEEGLHNWNAQVIRPRNVADYCERHELEGFYALLQYAIMDKSILMIGAELRRMDAQVPEVAAVIR